MEESTKNEYGFPEPFEYLDELISNDLNRIREIDTQLERARQFLSQPNPLQLNYKLPDYIKGRPSKNQNALIHKLEEERSKTLSKVKNTVEFQLIEVGADPGLRKQVNEVFSNKLNPNTFENLSPSQIRQAAGKKKDIDMSQDYLLAKKKISKVIKSVIGNKHDVELSKQGSKSKGQDFLQSLSSSKGIDYSLKSVKFKYKGEDFVP